MSSESVYQDHLTRFYDVIEGIKNELGRKRSLRDFDVAKDCPERGVYFMFEEGEHRRSPNDHLRVTRVGTHAIKPGQSTSLSKRLDKHRGKVGDGGKSRTSVLRRHVGKALMNKSPSRMNITTWGESKSISEREREEKKVLERMVTEYVGRMMVLWLPVPGNDRTACNKRAFIEENSIALLSNGMSPFDVPSKDWLGNYHPREEIRASGLWNVKHVRQTYDTSFLDKLGSEFP
jgi:hypothetical protein